MKRTALGLCLALLTVASAAPALAYFKHRQVDPSVQAASADDRVTANDINVVENLGQRVPRGLVFTDGQGRPVALDDFLGKDKPVLLTMGYFQCPMLCNLVHEGLAKAIKESGLQPGKDFLGLAVSVNPKEDPKSANTNQARLMRALGHGKGADWPFVYEPGTEAAVTSLAKAVGFKYKYDDQSKQYAHAAVAFLITPDGKIARYIYGVDFPARDFRLAVAEANEGRVGVWERVILSCFKYDPMTQRYTPFVFGFVRIGALASFTALAGLLAVLWRREIVMRRRRAA